MSAVTNGHAPAVMATPGDGAANIEITHAYVPHDAGQPWGLCRCGFAQAAHAAWATTYSTPGTVGYRCPNCVQLGIPSCAHTRPGETEI